MRRGVNKRRIRIEYEFALNPAGECDPRLQRATRGVEIGRAIIGDRMVERDQRRGIEIGGGARRGEVGAGACQRRDLGERRVAGGGDGTSRSTVIRDRLSIVRWRTGLSTTSRVTLASPASARAGLIRPAGWTESV